MFLTSRTIFSGILALLGAASCAFGQRQTISARPGLVNYFEGEAFLNGNQIAVQNANEPIFLNNNDVFSMGNGKAEILLMPGVFLRIGDHSQIRMISPSLANSELELLQGEAIIEAVDMVRSSNVEVLDHFALITFDSSGLYRIRAGDAPSAAVFQGLLEVVLDGQKMKLGKGHQTLIGGILSSEKIDMNEDDDLYAWSSVRSQYEAAASYQAAMSLASSGRDQTGWYFYDLLDCWAWLPRAAFFSPFGWGFYSTGLVRGAPVIDCTVLRGGHWGTYRPRPIGGGGEPTHRHWVGLGSTRTVPIDPKHPPALGVVASSPKAESEARSGESVTFEARPRNNNQRQASASHTGNRASSNHASINGSVHSTSSAGHSSGNAGGGGGGIHSSGGGSGAGGGGRAGGGGGASSAGGGGSHK